MVDSLKKVPDPGCVRIGSVAAILAVRTTLASEPPEQMFADVGLDLEPFENPDNIISFFNLSQLLELSAGRTGTSHFGLLVGQQAGLESVGRLAELAAYAPYVRSTLSSMILHVCTNDRGGVPTLTLENGVGKHGYAVYAPVREGFAQICSTSRAIIYKFLRSMCGGSWAPSEVLLTQMRQNDIRPNQWFFWAPLHFEAEEGALLFPESWLRHQFPNFNNERYKLALEHLAILKQPWILGSRRRSF